MGFTWAFHVTFTLNMLAERQPDIQEHGRIFSYAIIYIMNVLAIGVWMVLVGSPKLAIFSELLAREHTTAYTHAYRQVVLAWVHVARFIGNLN